MYAIRSRQEPEREQIDTGTTHWILHAEHRVQEKQCSCRRCYGCREKNLRRKPVCCRLRTDVLSNESCDGYREQNGQEWNDHVTNDGNEGLDVITWPASVCLHECF